MAEFIIGVTIIFGVRIWVKLRLWLGLVSGKDLGA